MITYYQANAELGYILGKRPYTPPADIYIGLSKTHISYDQTGLDEPPSETGYARVKIPNNTNSFSEPHEGMVKNLITIEFPEFKVDSGTAVDVFISDAATGGNIMYYDKLEKTRILQANSTLYFKPEGIKFMLTNETAPVNP